MVIIFCIYVVVLILFIFFHSYEKEFVSKLDKKKHPLILLYPMSLAISKLIFHHTMEQEAKKKEELRAIYVSEDIQVKYKVFQAQKVAVFIAAILVSSTIALLIGLTSAEESNLQEGGTIERPGYGESSKSVDVHVAIDDEGEYVEKDLTVTVDAMQYTAEAFEDAVSKATQYLDHAILGSNTSSEGICHPVSLVKKIPNSAIKVKWTLDEEGLINTDGTLNREGLETEQMISVEALLKSGNYEARHTIYLNILPRELTKEQSILYELENEIAKNNLESLTDKSLQLPDQIEDSKVYFQERLGNSQVSFLIFGVVVALLLSFLLEQRLARQKAERDIQIMLDYPELVNKVTLLLGAGMTMKRVWEKIAMEYLEKRDISQKRYAYEEVVATWSELSNGVNEVKAYENFGRRMKLLKYMKFSSMLSQNVTKGMEGLLHSLESEAMDAFEDRKELAKQVGEKASTKLLGPMMLLLGIVLMMILIPAAMTF